MPEASQDEREHVKALYNDGVPNSVISKRTGIVFLDVCGIIDDIIEERKNFKAHIAMVSLDPGWCKKIEQIYQERISGSGIKHAGIAIKGLENNNGTLVVSIYEDVAPAGKYVKRAFRQILKECSKIVQCPGSFRVSYRSGSVHIKSNNIHSRVLLGIYEQLLEGEMLERI